MKQSNNGSAMYFAGSVPEQRCAGECSNRLVGDAVRAALRGSSPVATASMLAISLGFSAGVGAQTASTDSAAKDDGLSEIIVTGRRAAIISADERKKNSETMIDSVVADEAGLLPDNSVTEVLQRVSGVTMVRFAALGDPDHFSSEGSGIQVRGLSGVAARLNGREVFSASTGQGLSFGDVTPELLQAVDVYKSSTADLIEGGSGGQVDLRTKMPFDYSGGLQFQASANGNYGDLAKKADPGASFLLSDRWNGPWGDFGVLVDIAYSKLDQKDDFIRNEPYYKTNIGGTDYYIPGGFDYGFDQFERTRQGDYVGLQWSPSDKLAFTETFFYSKYKTSGSGNGAFITSKILAVDPTVSTFNSNNVLIKSPSVFTRNPSTFTTTGASNMYATGDTGVDQSHSDTLDSSTTVQWRPSERWEIKGAFQWVNSISNDQRYDIFDSPPAGQGGYSLSETNSQPNIGFPASVEAQYANPADYTWSAHQWHSSHNDGEEHAVNLDTKFVISEDGFFRNVQVGARYSDRTEQDSDNGYSWSALCKGWNGCPTTTLATGGVTQAGDVSYQAFNNFFRGSVTPPGGLYLPSFGLVGTYNPIAVASQLSNGNITLTNPYGYAPVQTGYARSINTAGYAMVRFSNDSGAKFDGNFGVRVVRIEDKSRGYLVESGLIVGSPPPVAGTPTPPPLLLYTPVAFTRSGGRTTDRALPAFNIRFKPMDNLFIRAAYTVTLDQPSFNDTRANGTGGPSVLSGTNSQNFNSNDLTFSNSTGNPNLRPTISHNTDLSVEWYPKSSTTAHISWFYKTLDDTIVYGTTLKPQYYGSPTGTLELQPTSVTDDYNAQGTATIQGVELGARTFFDMLPGVLSGFGVEGNFTHINSNNPGDQYQDISGTTHTGAPIVGLSKNSFNLAAMYEKSLLSVRLAYNWRSQYLLTTSSNGTNGTYNYYPAAGAAGQLTQISLPIYAASYGELDFGVTVRPIPQLAFSLDLNNLTNETAKTLMGGYPNNEELVRSWFTSDRRILLSVKYKL